MPPAGATPLQCEESPGVPARHSGPPLPLIHFMVGSVNEA